jgi:hypothetical protein
MLTPKNVYPVGVKIPSPYNEALNEEQAKQHYRIVEKTRKAVANEIAKQVMMSMDNDLMDEAIKAQEALFNAKVAAHDAMRRVVGQTMQNLTR